MKKIFVLAGILFLSPSVYTQDSVDVTFRFSAPPSPTVFLVGEFNGWNNSATPMQYSGNNWWIKTYRLRVGGNPTPPSVGIVGTWQYKFYYSGVSTWPNDPLNPHQNPNDNNNTYIYTKDPTIYQFIPNQVTGLVRTASPLISAYIFPKIGASIDTSSIRITVDGTPYNNLGAQYDSVSRQLSFSPPTLLQNGKHTVSLFVRSTAGGTNSDSVSFTTQAGLVQITTQGGYSTYNAVRKIRGVILDTSIHTVKIVHNVRDTVMLPVSAGSYSMTDTLAEGLNSYKAVVNANGVLVSSDSVLFTLRINHMPYARAEVSTFTSDQIVLSAAGSTQPDGRALSFTWLDDTNTPLLLNGRQGKTVTITKPSRAGEYYFYLTASDSSGLTDTTRSYFIVDKSGSCTSPTLSNNPEWAKRARVYFLFPKAFTSAGTLTAAAQRLQYIHDLGFNIIWVMPVMKNAYPIDQHYGPGYNIVDFYTVAPEYGTNDDFKNFISQAHALGLKVILDVTPNHTSRFHPWSLDAHLYHEDSRYWTWYEHSNQPSSQTNNLGSSLDADGFNYYNGFSDQLLNFNWNDVDARSEMIRVYRFWIQYFGLDGFRFDVYWGPHRRYGEASMGFPVRENLKHIKPDILLLGEDDGTGPGTEFIYSDAGGGLDASYDFKLYFNQIRGFAFTPAAVDNLNSDIINGGYYPGPNSLYMRFMESQDEDCITYFYSNGNQLDAATTFNRTKPMASVIFTVPGFPMIWNGQEVGWGYGISGAKEDRNRSTIGWNFQGGPVLTPHYQKLAQIRGQFQAFSSQKFQRLNSSDGLVYAFSRPNTADAREDGIVAVNFGSTSSSVTIPISVSDLGGWVGGGKTYILSDLYNNTTSPVTFSTGGTATLHLTLPAYGTAICVLADSAKQVVIPTAVEDKSHEGVPLKFQLYQNYPNPFNPSTTIRFVLPKEGQAKIHIFNILGKEIANVADREYSAGSHEVEWNGLTGAGLPASTGVYFVRLDACGLMDTKKMILVR